MIMSVSKHEFKFALRRFASGVTIVTTRTADRQPVGLTVSAFTSLSLEPPLILICVDRKSGCHDILLENGTFAVNLLAADQEDLSRRFASKSPDKFNGLKYRDGIGAVPVLEGSLASLECKLVHAYEGGDHTIFIGHVEATTVRDDQPLLYFDGNYARIAA
jgi:flavin reductase (DIM6/NTAB) family NADH-FMN oxidoreductase RutF